MPFPIRRLNLSTIFSLCQRADKKTKTLGNRLTVHPALSNLITTCPSPSSSPTRHIPTILSLIFRDRLLSSWTLFNSSAVLGNVCSRSGSESGAGRIPKEDEERAAMISESGLRRIGSEVNDAIFIPCYSDGKVSSDNDSCKNMPYPVEYLKKK